MRTLAALMMMVAAVSAQEKVAVNFYGESLCPGCEAAVKTNINHTLTAEGVPGIMDFAYYPFGNAYMKIEACKLNPGFQCWEDHCGYKAKNPPPDCFTADVVCQHGPAECYGNLVETCVKNMTNNDATKYMPFVYCFEVGGNASEALLQKCAPIFGLDAAAVDSCAKGPQGKALNAIDGRTTAMVPGRSFVPYITVNGKALQESSLLLYTVCEDWKGKKPPGCPF